MTALHGYGLHFRYAGRILFSVIILSERAQPYPSSQKHFALSGTHLPEGVDAS